MGKNYYNKKNKKNNKTSLKTMIQKQIEKNLETKQVAYTYTNNPIGDQARTPFDVNLTAITEGDGQNNRTGNQIRITGFHAKFTYQAADSTNRIRVVLYIPHDAQNVLSTTTVDSLIDQDKHTVLYDEVINLVQGTAKDLVTRTISRKFNRGARKGILSIWSNNTATGNSKNALRIHWASDSLAVSDPTVSGTMRMYYKDG